MIDNQAEQEALLFLKSEFEKYSTWEDQNLSDQNKSLVWLGLTDDNETKGIETSSGTDPH